jgi:imidazolonepropionase
MDLLIADVRLSTMADGYGEIPDAAIAVQDGRVAWLGAGADAPAAAHTIDGGGAWLTPGLVDCHTHIVHAGNRSGEFEARLNGASYEDIARAGGGILSTVRATGALDAGELLRQSAPRVLRLLAEGVTTLEIKSGYGLSLASETAMLHAARRIGDVLPVRVATTFLGAHALPPEYAGRPDAYRRCMHTHAAATGAGGPGRRGRRFLRAHRFYPCPDRARVHCRRAAWAARQTAC